jgi:hypothetical protein
MLPSLRLDTQNMPARERFHAVYPEPAPVVLVYPANTNASRVDIRSGLPVHDSSAGA